MQEQQLIWIQWEANTTACNLRSSVASQGEKRNASHLWTGILKAQLNTATTAEVQFMWDQMRVEIVFNWLQSRQFRNDEK